MARYNHEEGSTITMNSLWQDLRFAGRTFSRNPAFAITAVAILALAVGLNSAVFSVVEALVLRPLPVREPERLVRIYSSEPGDFMSHSPMAAADADDLRDQLTGLTDLIAYFYTSLVVEHGSDSRLAMGAFVSDDYFDVLGVKPALGRGFDPGGEPDREATEPVAVLSHAAWQRHFGGDPAILGRSLRVNGRPVTVIGIAPKTFPDLTPGISPELWLPSGSLSTLWPSDRPPSSVERRRTRSWWVLGRLAPGASIDGVEAELTAAAARLAREFPETNADRQLLAVPADRVRILPGVDGRLWAASLAMTGVVALVLLIASANLANLLLARAAGRRREMAIRLALGAPRSALIRQLLTESLVLAFLGGGCGLWIAAGSNALLARVELPVPVHLALGLRVDAKVFLFTFAVSSLAALLFGLAPAFQASRTDLVAGLRGGPRLDRGRRRGGLRGALVVAQVAISFVLLICAGLALRSLQNARSLDPGFDPEGVVVATFAPQLQGYDRVRTEAFYERLLAESRTLSGIDSAALASHLPLSMEIHFENVAAAERSESPQDEWPRIDSTRVGPGYFRVLRIPLLRGRSFDERDGAEAPRVAVVNETLAERLWPDGPALGRRLRVAGAGEAYRVVGVAADGKYRFLGEPPQPHLFLAVDQDRWRRRGKAGEISSGSETLVARVRGDAGAALSAIRRVARELDETIAIARLTRLDEALAPSLWLPRMAAALFGLFGAVGLVLAATGIYGLLAFSVHRRIPELGLRMALGACRADVLALIVSDGLRLTALGLAAGLAVALAATRALAAWLYGVSASDPLTFATVALFLASVRPARQLAAGASRRPRRADGGLAPGVS
jgi:predicted permease